MGIYKDGVLIHEVSSEDKTSDALPIIMNNLLKTYPCSKLFYTKGPGSFMAIKISYIFLKTLSIALKVPFCACDTFQINSNNPIKAFGNNYFLKHNKDIVLKKFDKEVLNSIKLPKRLNNIDFTDDCEPLYVLPAI